MKDRFLEPSQLLRLESALRREERSPGTIEKYLRDARAFLTWLDGGAVGQETAAQWKQSLLERRLAPATINSMLAAVNKLFSVLGWTECRVKPLRVQRQMFRDAGRELTREDYFRLLRTAHRLGRDRLELLLETICATGIRVSEVRYMTVEAARQGKAEISLKGKIRTILLPGKLCRKLLQYAGRNRIASGEIFLTRGGKSLSRRQIWWEMKALCGQAGVSAEKVFPHNLRHLFARTFYRVCRDLVKLAAVLGHSSVETTRIYLLSSGSEHMKTLELLHLIC